MEQTLEMDLGGRPLSLQTGKLARQASGSVVISYGETIVLVTAVGSQEKEPA